MVKNSSPVRNVQITASVPIEHAEALEKIFFDSRGGYKRKNDVLREAVEQFLAKESSAKVKGKATKTKK